MLSRAAWETGIQMSFNAFSGNADADVVVIGGGLTGVTTALMLTSLGKHVVLLEQDELGCGATQGCTGKITAHQPEVYTAIHRSAGRRTAQAYANLMKESVQDVRDLLTRLQHPLGMQPSSMCCYAAAKRDLPQLRRYAALEDQLGLPISITPNRLPNTQTEQAVSLPDQLVVEPLGYLAAMVHMAYLMGCRIYEHSRVIHYSEHRVQTTDGMIRSAWVIAATGYPLDLHRPSVMTMMQQHTLEARILRTSQHFDACWLDTADNGVNLRPIRQGILLSTDLGPSGRSHKQRDAQTAARQLQLLPDAREVQRLHRQDVFTMDGLPLIGPIHPPQPHLLMSTGYNGWGLTGSMLAARVLSGIICGKPVTQAPLLLPHRLYPGHWMQQLRGGVRMAGRMMGGWLHPSAPTCPHMGCKLTYQPETSLWECPCHGSCFDTHGACQCTPANQAASVPRKP